MRKRLNIPYLPVLCALLLVAAGCDRGDGLALISETDEPYYRQGQQLSKQGRKQEALNAYLKVIAKRDETAPESHLEAGLILMQHVKDPIAAIYHFRKYRELQPNSKQSVYVGGLIEAARRDYARTLSATPMESQAERLETQEQIDRLLRENDQLKAELAALHAGVASGTPTIRTRGAVDPNAAPGGPVIILSSTPAETPAVTVDDSPVTYAPVESPAPEPAPTIQRAPTGPPTRAVPTKPTAPSGRHHTVTKGDTLYNLAQRYYGTRTKAKVQAIVDANRDVLTGLDSPLRLGMDLKIP